MTYSTKAVSPAINPSTWHPVARHYRPSSRAGLVLQGFAASLSTAVSSIVDAIRTRRQRLLLIAAVHRLYNDANLRPALLDLLRGDNAIQPRHLDIQQDHMRLQLFCQMHRGHAIYRMPDTHGRRAGFQQGCGGGSGRGVIVGDEQPDSWRCLIHVS